MNQWSLGKSRSCIARVVEKLALCGIGALAGCGTHVSEQLRSNGSVARPVFPANEKATRPEGSFPERRFLAQAEPGLRKPHLLQWFGPPHFGEGLAGVREWDYIFHFYSGGGITTCRYKVVFDQAYVARSFHWQPKDCGDWLSTKVPAQAQGHAAP